MSNVSKISRRSYLKWSAAATASFCLPGLTHAAKPAGKIHRATYNPDSKYVPK